jgi:hypothetical protein
MIYSEIPGVYDRIGLLEKAITSETFKEFIDEQNPILSDVF